MTTMEGSRFHSDGMPPLPSDAALSPMLPAALCSLLTSCTTPPKVFSVLSVAMAATAWLFDQHRLPAAGSLPDTSQYEGDRRSHECATACQCPGLTIRTASPHQDTHSANKAQRTPRADACVQAVQIAFVCGHVGCKVLAGYNADMLASLGEPRGLINLPCHSAFLQQ